MAENKDLLLTRAKSLEDQCNGLLEAVYDYTQDYRSDEVRSYLNRAFTLVYADIVRKEAEEKAKVDE